MPDSHLSLFVGDAMDDQMALLLQERVKPAEERIRQTMTRLTSYVEVPCPWAL